MEYGKDDRTSGILWVGVAEMVGNAQVVTTGIYVIGLAVLGKYFDCEFPIFLEESEMWGVVVL